MQEATFIEEIFGERLENVINERVNERLNERVNEVRAQIRREGRQEGRQEGVWQASYENILDILIARFNPSAARYRQIERQLALVQDVEKLRELLLTLVQVEDLAGFEQALSQVGRLPGE